ncbi:MAG: hypothetical protein Q9191_003260 [Dirinaria sp. TL-2023a]
MAGDELYNYLINHGRLPLEKVQKIFTQLVGAVAYVHNLSCVHRDLKLENILLDKNENVKLCDFGFTREYEGKASYLQTFCGTICYSAPEMLKGEKYAGEKVDVWSLGVILYALLTGELPFDDDDDLVTKHKILSTEPQWPEEAPPEAKALVTLMLSKRPLIRPTLADILTHPFLAEHAPQQQVILKLTQPAPFSTPVEKDTLERMRSAGVDIDRVIESVLAQRCDPLAGWWALAIEKEERKEKRRERKRKEREADAKALRRLSAASSRRERIGAPLKEVEEEQFGPSPSDAPRLRGRQHRRSTPTRELPTRRLSYGNQAEDAKAQIILPELPQLPEGAALDSPQSPTPPPPIEKDSVRSSSSSRPRPPLPPKEPSTRSKQRSSTLQLVHANPDLLKPPNGYPKRRPSKKHHSTFISQLAHIKHWFVESAKRAKSPSAKSDVSTLKVSQEKRTPPQPGRSPPVPTSHRTPPSTATSTHQPVVSYPSPPHLHANRSSLSPGPLTPRSASYRRTSNGLRGRKSTSSSVSSIRSMHRPPAHSKASSTSSTTNSVTSSAIHHSSAKSSSANNHRVSSPHSSVKVLPATPTFGTFPSNIRLVRAPPSHDYNEAFGPAPGSSSLVFAKRRKTPFRGPALTLGTSISGYSPGSSRAGSAAGGGGAPPSRSRDQSVGSHRSASAAGRRSGEIIEEEDEEDEIEEVDTFSPVLASEAEEVVWESKTGGEVDGSSGEWVRRKRGLT